MGERAEIVRQLQEARRVNEKSGTPESRKKIDELRAKLNLTGPSYSSYTRDSQTTDRRARLHRALDAVMDRAGAGDGPSPTSPLRKSGTPRRTSSSPYPKKK